MSRFASRPTRFVLVADDFAMTPGVSRAILDLIGRERLSGTGIMANRPHWRALAADLRAFDGRVDLGLHFNLTLGEPLTGRSPLRGGTGLPSFGAMAKAAFTGGLDKAALCDEVIAQVDACVDGLGRLPDFIDGHQHVHVLPGVRRALLDAVARRWPAGSRPWLRDPFDTLGSVLVRGVAVGKALTIAALSVGWRRQAVGAGCPTNRGFAGVSPFDPARDFGADMARFLAVPGEAHLVMCHPGFVDDELVRLDPVVATRPQEHAWLAGEGFPALLAETRLSMVRFAALGDVQA